MIRSSVILTSGHVPIRAFEVGGSAVSKTLRSCELFVPKIRTRIFKLIPSKLVLELELKNLHKKVIFFQLPNRSTNFFIS